MIKLNDFIQFLKQGNPQEQINMYYNKAMGLYFVKRSTKEVFAYRRV